MNRIEDFMKNGKHASHYSASDGFSEIPKPEKPQGPPKKPTKDPQTPGAATPKPLPGAEPPKAPKAPATPQTPLKLSPAPKPPKIEPHKHAAEEFHAKASAKGYTPEQMSAAVSRVMQKLAAEAPHDPKAVERLQKAHQVRSALGKMPQPESPQTPQDPPQGPVQPEQSYDPVSAAKKLTANMNDRTAQPNPIRRLEGKREYQYGANQLEQAKNLDFEPQQIDPKDLVSDQPHIGGDRLARIAGELRKAAPGDTPAVVVKSGDKLILEEGNHRAVHALRTGQKLPAKVIEIDEKGRVRPASPAQPAPDVQRPQPPSWSETPTADEGDEPPVDPIGKPGIAEVAGTEDLDDPQVIEHARKLWKEKGTESPYFKRWFKQSAVKDEAGEPLKLFHGTGEAFDTFDPDLAKSRTGSNEAGFGFHFGTSGAANKAIEDRVTAEGSQAVPVYLNVQNPLEMRDVFKQHPEGVAKELQRLGIPLSRRTLASLEKPGYETFESLKDDVMAAGYDGVKYANDVEGGTSYIAFKPEQIKSATGNRGTFDPDNSRIDAMQQPEREQDALGFTSNINDALRSWQGKGTPQQLLAHLLNPQNGFAGAADQAKEIGLLAGYRVTNDPSGKVYGNPEEAEVARKELKQSNPRGKFNVEGVPGSRLEGRSSVTREEIAEMAAGEYPELEEVSEAESKKPERWAITHGRNGGSQVYDSEAEARAAFNAMPNNGEFFLDRHQEDNDSGPKFSEYVTPGPSSDYDEIHITAPGAKGPGQRTMDDVKVETEPMRTGTLVRLRDKSGKVIATEIADRDFDTNIVAQNLLHDLNRKASPDWQDGHSDYAHVKNPVVRIRYNTRTDADGKKVLFIEEMQGPSAENQKKMPDWLKDRIYDIGMKRVLRKAADEGYDRVAWTTGEMQADRYSLAKKVKDIAWGPRGRSEKQINVNHNGGMLKLTVDRDGIVNSLDDLDGKSIADVIGKELAAKIMGEEAGKIEGEGLSIGGEGLKRLYDRDLPAKAAKLLKKVGGKVGRTGIDLGGKPAGTIRNMSDRTGPEFVVLDAAGRPVGTFESSSEAEVALAKLSTARDTAPVHSIDITPQVKAHVSEGQPLYMQQPGGQPGEKQNYPPPPQTPKAKQMSAQLMDAASVSLQSSAIPPEQQEKYRQNVQQVLSHMTEKGLAAVMRLKPKWVFQQSPKHIMDAIASGEFGSTNAREVKKDIAKGVRYGGVIVTTGGQRYIIVDGDTATVNGAEYKAHEIGHLEDYREDGTRHSDTPEWRRIHAAEMADGQVSEYGAKSAMEGWAELRRKLNSGYYDRGVLKAEHPRAFAYMVREGLTADVQPKQGSSEGPEVFDGKTVLNRNGEHADHAVKPASPIDNAHKAVTDAAQPHHKAALDLIYKAAQGKPAAESHYRNAASVIGRMTPKASAALSEGMSGIEFADDHAGILPALMAISTPKEQAELKAKYSQPQYQGKPVGGIYAHSFDGDPNKKIVIANGDYEGIPAAQVQAHEFGHAIDGPKYRFSSTPEWQQAYVAEIRNKQANHLSDYAADNPRDAFAEFARLVYGQGASLKDLRQKWPEATAFWEKNGLILPQKGMFSRPYKPLAEIFDKAINTATSHVDTLKADAVQPQREPKPVRTETPEFKRWFKQSAVRDESGEPLTAYHATGKDFKEFSPDAGGESAFGFHFGTADSANDIARRKFKGGANTIPAYLSVQNPIELPDLFGEDPRPLYRHLSDTIELSDRTRQLARIPPSPESTPKLLAALRKDLIAAGYDGVKYQNAQEGPGSTSWIAFSPTQIKSAIANSGEYDPENPRIDKMIADHVKPIDPKDIYSTKHLFKVTTRSPDNKLREQFSAIRNDNGRWDVMFSDRKHETGATGKAGTRAVGVFGRVASAMNEFLTQKNPRKFSFTADMSEPARVRLYDRFAAELAEKFGYKLKTMVDDEENPSDGDKYYSFRRPKVYDITDEDIVDDDVVDIPESAIVDEPEFPGVERVDPMVDPGSADRNLRTLAKAATEDVHTGGDRSASFAALSDLLDEQGKHPELVAELRGEKPLTPKGWYTIDYLQMSPDEQIVKDRTNWTKPELIEMLASDIPQNSQSLIRIFGKRKGNELVDQMVKNWARRKEPPKLPNQRWDRDQWQRRMEFVRSHLDDALRELAND
jgi:hypothetical protein